MTLRTTDQTPLYVRLARKIVYKYGERWSEALDELEIKSVQMDRADVVNTIEEARAIIPVWKGNGTFDDIRRIPDRFDL